MSSVKKLTIKRGLRSPFSRKSSKKDGDDEKEKDYDDDFATTDPKKGGNLRESANKSRKWPFKGKSVKHRGENNGKIEHNDKNEAILNDSTNSQLTYLEPGSSHEKLEQQRKCDREAGYATADQNGFADKSVDHEQYVTPVRLSHDGDGISDGTFVNTDIGAPDTMEAQAAVTFNSEGSENGDKPTSQTDFSVCLEETGAPRLPPKPPSLRGRKICHDDSAKSQEVELPPRPPARQRNRTMGRDPNPPHLRGIAIADTGGQYETIKIDPDPSARTGGGLGAELAKLKHQPWYWGPLTQEEAEEKLNGRADGSFLVRDSSDERHLLSLSFKSHGRSLHTRIEHKNGMFSLNDSEGHTSIVELIEQAVKESRDGVYGYMRDSSGLQSYPAQLKNWVSRFTRVRSLQHSCRFVIRAVYPVQDIQRLPLPRKIKEYILENPY